MRSAGGTKSGPPSFVTRATKSRIADFAGPSFQEASIVSSIRGESEVRITDISVRSALIRVR